VIEHHHHAAGWVQELPRTAEDGGHFIFVEPVSMFVSR
jgi:hypothetical protein